MQLLNQRGQRHGHRVQFPGWEFWAPRCFPLAGTVIAEEMISRVEAVVGPMGSPLITGGIVVGSMVLQTISVWNQWPIEDPVLTVPA